MQVTYMLRNTKLGLSRPADRVDKVEQNEQIRIYDTGTPFSTTSPSRVLFLEDENNDY